MGIKIYEYMVQKPLSVAELKDSLIRKFPITVDSIRSIRRSYQDSFDWRLYNNKLIYFVESGLEQVRITLCDLATKEQFSLAVERPPVFAQDIESAVLKRKVAPVLGVRALMDRMSINIHRCTMRYVDEEQKSLAYLHVDEYELLLANGKSRVLDTRVRIEPVRGYHKMASMLARYLKNELQMLQAKESVFLQGIRECGISPGEHGSQLQFTINPDLRTDEAIKDMLLSSLDVMMANERGVINAIDVEFLHDFRVAVRRTRSILSQVKGVFPKKIVERFVPEFRWLGAITGPVRDAHVYLLKFNNYQQALPADMRSDLEPLREFLMRHRDIEQAVLSRHLTGSRYRELVTKWRGYLQMPVPARTTLPHARQAVKQTADAHLWKAFKRVSKQGRAITPECADEELHRLRIACKKLRYLLEFFHSLYPAGKTLLPIRSLKELQDTLGDFHDYLVQIESVKHFEEQMIQEGALAPATHQAILLLVAYFRGQMQGTRVLFKNSFANFSGKQNRALFAALCKPTFGNNI